MCSNIISNYANIILKVAVAVFIIVSNHAWHRLFLWCVWQVPVKLLIKIFTIVHIHSCCLCSVYFFFFFFFFFWKGSIPLCIISCILHSVPSIHDTYKDQMLYYNWVILGNVFRPLNGHLQANILYFETCVNSSTLNTCRDYQSCVSYCRR